MASTATTKIDTVTATIPSLHSQLIGEIDRDHGIVHFRGIPYATVTERWTHSRPLHQLNEIFDATRYGPRCEQPADGLVLVTGGTNDPTPGDDEFGCLNLNISVPAECLDLSGTTAVKKGVPVMFWIHGQVSTSTFVARRTTDKDAAVRSSMEQTQSLAIGQIDCVELRRNLVIRSYWYRSITAWECWALQLPKT